MKTSSSNLWNSACVATALVVLATHAQASPILIPAGLNPGDTYRIIFVTTTKTAATSNNINTYNNLVSAEAAADTGLNGLGTTWAALASTASVNARANVGLSNADATTMFFNTAGQLIATGVLNGVTGLFGGPTTTHNAVFAYADGSVNPNAVVWTGTDANGSSSFSLGDPFHAVKVGHSGVLDASWTADVAPDLDTTLNSLYGISGVLTVPTATPEPATVGITGLGIILAVAFSNTRRRGVR